jgi:hypothetical protein
MFRPTTWRGANAVRERDNLTGVIVRIDCPNCRRQEWARLERTANPAAAPRIGALNTFAHHFAICLECDYVAADHWNWHRIRPVLDLDLDQREH